MARIALSGRLRLQVELALLGGEVLPPRQEARARGFGMTRAEVGAVRGGRAHDVRAAAAVALARAARDGGAEELAAARSRATRCGFGEAALAAIEALARRPLK